MSTPPARSHLDRIFSARPTIGEQKSPKGLAASLPRRPATTQATHGRSPSSSFGDKSGSPRIPQLAHPLDALSSLQKTAPGVVKTRQGSVLTRGFILKTDYYPSGRALELDINLQGAPNFRSPRQADMNVYGVAQPRVAGLKAILSVLGCRPNAISRAECHWFSTREEPIVYISGRSFVLRDSAEPLNSLSLSDRAENIEAIENRLKADILAEAGRFGGVILTHHELDDGEIIPTWTAVDTHNLNTQRELMERLKSEGWSVQYHRIPITPDRPIEDNYLDAYLDVIKHLDPLETPLVFSCGMGAVRTTFAMTAACIIRRKQILWKGFMDPYFKGAPAISGASTPAAAAALEQASLQLELNRSLLRLTYILQRGLGGQDSQSAIELLVEQPSLMENLRKAHMGIYSLILSLLGCLDHGTVVKKLVDRIVDDCDHVTNLREEILAHRVKYSLVNMDDKARAEHLGKAVKSMEKYFFIIVFASFVEEQQDAFEHKFSDWMQARVEIWNQVKYMRKSGGLKVFAPVADLSAISKVEAVKKHEMSATGGQVLGDEWTEYVVKNRGGIILREGTLLKSDQWRAESRKVENGVRGAMNFRHIQGTNIYCLGQPTTQAIHEVLARVTSNTRLPLNRIVWITLREEPIVYVNGDPYCLRREVSSLRNMKDYGGISASRLETLEERLKSDVVAELGTFSGRLLLHSENSEGSVIPIWEEVDAKNVAAIKDVMSEQKVPQGIPVQYHRIPITSERPPDFSDISDLMDVVLRSNDECSAIIVNCQLGRGRSTLSSILIYLIQQWLQSGHLPSRPRTPHRQMSKMSVISYEEPIPPSGPKRHSYQVINNLLRVIRNGLHVKEIVDNAIDKCGEVFNLRDSIELFRIAAEETTDDRMKKLNAQRAIQNLRRYFEIIIFQAYLQSTTPDTLRDVESFETYVKNRPVFKTFENEMTAHGVNSLKPLERMDVADGIALPDEITQTVANRSGNVLSASTILKSDFFSNLQKMSLPERIEGAANFRQVSLLLDLPKKLWSPVDPSLTGENKIVVGTGMPQTDGARRVLARLGATQAERKKVYWTSLREEPVIYVAGKPHVLRLVDRPLQNVEATGITTDVVERMENALRRDVQREIIQNEGRILLHDEVEDSPGRFTITAQWETVQIDDVMTPRDLFDMMVKEGYQVDYTRVAITDERAPLPAALDQLMQRATAALRDGDVIIQNCQMGRGRTTTGMVCACLIATISNYDVAQGLGSEDDDDSDSSGLEDFVMGRVEGSEEEAYLQGEYKTILQLVGILSHGKVAKKLTDMATDAMEGVQNLRRAIFDYKVKVDACEPGSVKQRKLMDLGVNYLYRYGTMIVLANYLIERREKETAQVDFPTWMKTHREITTLLGRRNLD